MKNIILKACPIVATIPMQDLERAKKFYREVLGLAEKPSRAHEPSALFEAAAERVFISTSARQPKLIRPYSGSRFRTLGRPFGSSKAFNGVPPSPSKIDREN